MGQLTFAKRACALKRQSSGYISVRKMCDASSARIWNSPRAWTKLRLLLLCVAISLSMIGGPQARTQSQQTAPAAPTIKVTSALVFLDVTVLDKNGNPVVSGLTKDDFTITEDKIPQAIFSFEAPEAHVMLGGAEDESPNGSAPATILVMDLLNSRFEDFAFIQQEVRRFLRAQPPRLASPTELLVVGNDSLDAE